MVESKTHRRASEAGAQDEMRSVTRTLQLLGLLIYAPHGRRLTDLAHDMGLPKSTVLRLLRALISRDVARRDEKDQCYRLSPAVLLTMAVAHAHGHADTTERLPALLQELAQASGVTAILCPRPPSPVMRRVAAAAFAVAETHLRVVPELNAFPLMHATSAGKCYLASLSEDDLSQWLAGELGRATDRTVTDPDLLREEIARVRKQGYAVSREEHRFGVADVAVPVRDAEGGFLCSLMLAVPSALLTQEDLARWLTLLREAATRLPRALAGDPRTGVSATPSSLSPRSSRLA